MTSSVNEVIIIQLILRSIIANLSSLRVDLGFNLLSTLRIRNSCCVLLMVRERKRAIWTRMKLGSCKGTFVTLFNLFIFLAMTVMET